MADSPYKTSQWRKLRPTIYERDRGICQVCEPPHPVDPHGYDVDHIVPWLEGGSWFDPSNLRLSCPGGNRGRSGGRLAQIVRINRNASTEPSRDW